MAVYCKNLIQSLAHCGHTSNRTKCLSVVGTVNENVLHYNTLSSPIKVLQHHKTYQSGKVRQSVLKVCIECHHHRTLILSSVGSFEMRRLHALLVRMYSCAPCTHHARVSGPTARLIPQRRHISTTDKARQSVAPTLEQLRQPSSKKNASTL